MPRSVRRRNDGKPWGRKIGAQRMFRHTCLNTVSIDVDLFMSLQKANSMKRWRSQNYITQKDEREKRRDALGAQDKIRAQRRVRLTYPNTQFSMIAPPKLKYLSNSHIILIPINPTPKSSPAFTSYSTTAIAMNPTIDVPRAALKLCAPRASRCFSYLVGKSDFTVCG